MIARFCGLGVGGWFALQFAVCGCRLCLLVLVSRLVSWCVRLWLIWIAPCG